MRFTPFGSKYAIYFLTAIVAAALLLFILLTSANDASAQQSATATLTPTASGPAFPPVPPKRTPPLGNLDSMLSQMASSVQGGYSTAHDVASQAPMHADDSVAVTFYLNGDTAPLLAFLRANGGDPRNIGDDYVEAYVPVALLAEASEQPNVVRVQAIVPPQPAGKGSVISQGVAAHAANVWHTAGYTGAGVKVGVIDGGFEGFSALMGSELPANVTARCYTDIGLFTSNLADCETDGTHGTAVSETLLDIAPDVTLYIANPIAKGDLRHTVNWLVEQDVDVINMSLSWTWDGPGDGASPFSFSPLRSVDAAANSEALFVNSAGNKAKATWFGAFSDTDSNNYLNFESGVNYNAVELEAGVLFKAQLRWEGNWQGAERDLDLFLSDAEGEFVAAGEDFQDGETGDTPYEFITFTPAASDTYYLWVLSYSGDSPGWVQLQAFSGEDLVHYTERGSIGNPAESANPGLLAVGAASYWDVNTIASYSSRGPTPDGRIKPDIVGADCAATSTDGAGFTVTTGQRCWFAGTSQASAHIAGLAALVKQRFPDDRPAHIELEYYLEHNAEPRGAVPNNDWGYGFAKLPNPTEDSRGPEPTPIGTPSPTPTGTSGTGSPTPTATSTTVPTPVGGAIEGRVSALEDLIRRLESMMMAFESRLAALEGSSTAPTPTSTPSPTPTRVSGATSFSSITTGGFHTCGLRADGSTVCWGENHHDQSTPPSGEIFTSISAGGSHSCGLRHADGLAVCWGYDDHGQFTPPSDETFTSISAGGSHLCGLRHADGLAVCWGYGDRGQTTPPEETFASISAGGFHTCGLRADGSTVCWGENHHDQSTPPSGEIFASISAGQQHTCGLRRADGVAVCWGDNEGDDNDGQSTPPSGETFASISAGWWHTCGLRHEDRSAVCWGDNDNGQSSPPSGETFTSLSAGAVHTCGLRADGSVACWGSNGDGQGTPP